MEKWCMRILTLVMFALKEWKGFSDINIYIYLFIYLFCEKIGRAENEEMNFVRSQQKI